MTTLSTVHSGSYQPSATANPFTIELTGQIDANSSYALYLNADTTWYALNQGLITANSGDGVDLVSGTIVNQASIGATYGVVLRGTGTLINQGDISASTVGVTTGINGTLYVSNASTGVITGGFLAVGAQYSTGTVVNAGTLIGGTFGIYANAGISLTNSGTILGTSGDGIKARQGTIDITNEVGGTIGGGYDGIYLGDASYGTIVNAGTIAHGASNPNALDASYAGDTIDVVVDPGAVFLGTVAGTATDRLDFAAGTTAGTFYGLGSHYTGFGSYTVDAGASWTAASTNNFTGLTVAGTLANAGTATGGGLYVAAGGVFDNLSGAAFTSTGTGVIAAAGATVLNIGTIRAGTTIPGTYLDAVTFAAGPGNVMALYPGAVVIGTIDGGNTLGATASSTLELTGGDGYLNGLNTQFTNFADIYIANGAVWALGSYATILAGQTVDGGGTLDAAYGVLNQGTILLPIRVEYVSTTISNAAGATIAEVGSSAAIDGFLGTTNVASVLNAGTIYGFEYGIGIEGATDITNLAGGLITASDHFFLASGIALSGGAVDNQGTIASQAIGVFTAYRYYGVPTVTNSGTIVGYEFAVLVGGAGALTNTADGTLAGLGAGVFVYSGSFLSLGGGPATIVNQGTIQGDFGVSISHSYTTLDNSGYIKGYTLGVSGNAVTISVTNEAQGTIIGYDEGVVLTAAAGATLINAGTIAGGPGPAVYLAGGAANRLVVQPGAVFYGEVTGGNPVGATVASTLEFAAGAGTLAGFGLTIGDFYQMTFDTGAQWLLAGPAYGFDTGQTISGFAPGNTIELIGVHDTYSAFAGGILTLSDGTTLDLPGASNLKVTNDGTNTFITACFASGTKIAGEFGPVPVEALRVGDLVRTARGRLAPVRWIGHRRTDLARHPRPLDVMPVRIHADAFGPSLPSRDLILSPDHAVFVRGRLIPIRYLINNVSIVQETRTSITYWHVELDEHDVILAEDLPCESYLDTGNRSAFENAPDAVQMTPDFARGIWATQGCAPIVTDPADPTLRLLHTKLMARARRAERAA